MAEEEISLSTIITFLLVAGAIVWKLFLSPSESTANDAAAYANMSRGATRDTRALEQSAERLLQMFPQVDRRTVLWDLRRNGNQIQETTERILSGNLERPPNSFRPPPPPGQREPAPPKPLPKKDHQDLISRYQLEEKLSRSNSSTGTSDDGAATAESGTGAKPSGKAWSSNRDERQALLRKRREEMILKARRQMEAKLAAAK
ncbi:hypothetical protein TD95_004192 [Thielaviopsis punctulata]|uniref:CUE domain-containing protein n=1 Tax=Thielaviopsis punctulata TaxID=72032 RepID=A0A0F4ZJK5_9PEZI|nr:hypothetical protein TD95_004192 [Thielaviopsis punctulata]